MYMLDDMNLTQEEKTNKAIERTLSHIKRKKLNSRQRYHLKRWTEAAAHYVFQTHPELREEGSLFRYFVAKAGRKKGLRGVDVTKFVDDSFADGTAVTFVPQEVIDARL